MGHRDTIIALNTGKIISHLIKAFGCKHRVRCVPASMSALSQVVRATIKLSQGITLICDKTGIIPPMTTYESDAVMHIGSVVKAVYAIIGK